MYLKLTSNQLMNTITCIGDILNDMGITTIAQIDNITCYCTPESLTRLVFVESVIKGLFLPDCPGGFILPFYFRNLENKYFSVTKIETILGIHIPPVFLSLVIQF